MNKFKYYFILLLAGISLVSCSKKDDDEPVVVPLRDYKTQYDVDNANIEEYLKTNYITVNADMDVTISLITDPSTQPSIMSYLNSDSFPKLLLRDIDLHGIAYKMYYLVLREGVGTSPMNTDGVVAAYRGEYLSRIEKTVTVPSHLTTTFFEQVLYPNSAFDLYGAIMGWSEIFPQFKTGTTSVNADGSNKYENFGAGVLFIPSGLGYYASPPASSTIPVYSPLIFSFKLYDFKRLDHEYVISNGAIVGTPDGVLDINEDIDGDGYVRDYRNTTLYPNKPVNPDDTDGDGIPDFLDSDDDGDGYTTRFEITKPSGAPVTGVSLYYPWDPVVDNPATPNTNESETFGIPRKPTGELTDPAKPESIDNPRKFVDDDYAAAGRKRIHVDNTYPYQKK
ncbi:FKBP-type peptidyl-prolyl cis-trans isomerase [Flavobacterium sp. JAS]|uniref:FKBP-type peptidyl-prolyl cis-trans isomerase n=1 Tax=Flavobacterium sp. JAS TaxID=2897329 RepID=UPI001E33C5D8|nr:FKBP-type peptidylprolyl isomerase [Flavobacterium sp. JAS]MCD0472180.1 FKBP-type peptidylprolyl isomerase [Flavobacterium sp. JAS]